MSPKDNVIQHHKFWNTLQMSWKSIEFSSYPLVNHNQDISRALNISQCFAINSKELVHNVQLWRFQFGNVISNLKIQKCRNGQIFNGSWIWQEIKIEFLIRTYKFKCEGKVHRQFFSGVNKRNMCSSCKK